jgi:tetratricopeptide (TPR) repeat protein
LISRPSNEKDLIAREGVVYMINTCITIVKKTSRAINLSFSLEGVIFIPTKGVTKMKNACFQKLAYLLIALMSLVNSSSYSQENDEITGLFVFQDHEIYLQQLFVISFGSFFPYSSYPAGETTAVLARLQVAEQELGAFFGQYYGLGIDEQVITIYSTYDNYAMQLINAYKVNDPNLAGQIIQQWISYAEAIATYFHDLDPSYTDLTVLTDLMVNITYNEIWQIQNLFIQDYEAAIQAYDKARSLAGSLGFYLGFTEWEQTGR